MNKTTSYTELRQKLKSYFDQACDDHVPIYVKRKNGGNVVIISEDDYLQLDETAYLKRSPENNKRLLRAIKRVDNNKGLKSFKNIDELADELGINDR